MGTCVFKTSEIKRCVSHALSSTQWDMGYSDEAPAPAILIVHDHGVYIMSNGNPRDRDGESNYVAYAKGCDPRKDEDFYDNAHYLVGGDDFAECFPITLGTLQRCDQYEEFRVKFNKNSISITFNKPKKK